MNGLADSEKSRDELMVELRELQARAARIQEELGHRFPSGGPSVGESREGRELTRALSALEHAKAGWEREAAHRRSVEERLQSLATHARCILWYADIEGLPGWQDDFAGGDNQFKWDLQVPDEEAAQSVVPVEVPPGETYAKAWTDLRHPEDRVAADRVAADAFLHGKSTYSQEFRSRDKYGVDRWLFEDVYIEPVGVGRWRAVGVCIDVTERKRLEEQLRHAHHNLEQRVEQRTGELLAANGALLQEIAERRRAEERLEQGEQRYRSLFENNLDGVFSVDLEGRFTDANPAAQRLSGYSLEELRGRTFMDICAPDVLGKTMEQFQLSLGGMRTPFEGALLRKDGARVELFISGAPIVVDGKAVGTYGIARDITERKAAEAALRDSENRFRAFFEMAAVGTALADPGSGRFLLVNQRLCQLVGYTREELLQRTFSDISHPHDRPENLREFERLQRGEIPQYILEKRYLRKDGSAVWVQVAVSMVRDSAGKALHTVGIVLDIDARRASEDALRRSEQRLRRVIDSNMIGVFFADGHRGTLVEANESFLKLLGLSRDELLSRSLSWMDFTPPEYLPMEERVWHDAGSASGGVAAPYEKEFIRKDGSRVPALVGWAFLDDWRDSCVAFVLDLSQYKQAQEALRRRERELETIASHTPDVLGRFDRDLRIVFVNRTVKEVFGREPASLLGRTVRELGMAPEVAGPFEAALRRVLETAQHQVFEFRLPPARVIAAEEGARYFESRLVPEFDAAGEVAHVLTITQDVTEDELARAELERTKEAAEEANQAKDQFLAMLSHELRTPLTPVLIGLQLLEKNESMPDSIRSELQIMRRNVELETRLIDDLLDLTRITRGKMQLRMEALELPALLEQAVRTCDDAAAQKGVALELRVEGPVLWAWADSARLKQVVWNLVKNSIKFTPAGGRINVSLDALPEGRAAIRVVDTGIGIDEALLPSIFNPFEQGGVHITRQFGGLGLGLAICRALVELHGGTIAAASEGKDRGSTFTVLLPTIPVPASATAGAAKSPASDAMASAAAPATEREATAASGAPMQPLRILLVEDHEHTARMLSLLLQASHRVRVAPTCQAARDAADAEAFDLVISDLGLPDGSGHELMAHLRERHGLRGVALSGFGMEDDLARSRKAGFIDHLVKPVDLDRLEQVLRLIAGSLSKK